MTKNWIAVACAAHVRIGCEGGFMQVNHGKLAPLKRIHPLDMVAYYSPSEVLRQPDGLQSFTALGQVKPSEPYQASMHGGKFLPFRRDVEWVKTHVTPIRPLLQKLEFTCGKSNWGYQFRFGLFEISAADMAMISHAMSRRAAQMNP